MCAPGGGRAKKFRQTIPLNPCGVRLQCARGPRCCCISLHSEVLLLQQEIELSGESAVLLLLRPPKAEPRQLGGPSAGAQQCTLPGRRDAPFVATPAPAVLVNPVAAQPLLLDLAALLLLPPSA